MFSINIKRSVVSVGVVAGFLAAAGPASAQGGGADFTRFASPGPPIGTTEVLGLNTFGSFDPVEHRGGNDTQLAAGGAPHGLKSDGNEVAVEGLKAGAGEVLYETVTLAHERDPSYRPQASTVEGLAVIYDVPPAVVADAGKGDDTITQAREPAHTVTMLDYEGSP